VAARVKAGADPAAPLRAGCIAYITTGAKLPEGERYLW
jgi:molybdopterin biosynthesis enzyme